MFAFKPGLRPAKLPRAQFARAAAVAALSSLAGCASTHNPYTTENVPVAPPQALAQAAIAEDDGRPAQALPTGRLRLMPDEPNEPFSKNYGGKNPSNGKHQVAEMPARPTIPAPVPKIPNDLPAAFRKTLMQAMAENE